jgi:hypothetical protein
MTLGLFDLEDRTALDVYVVFCNRPAARSRWWRLLKDGFQHVEVWKTNGLFWMRYDPCMEHGDMTAHYDPPWVTIRADMKPLAVRVRRALPRGKMHTVFTAGPVTCVELTKAFIGMRAFFVRTPYQLYRKLTRRE